MPINQLDTSIALGVKPPASISLADMANIAGAAQAYKQKQLLNPLEVRQKEVETTKAEETLKPAIEKAKAEAEQAQTQLNTLQLENTRNHFTNMSQNLQELMMKPDLTAQDIVDRATEINKNAGGNEKSLRQMLIGLPMNGNKTQLKQFLAQAQLKSLSALSQVEKMYPAASYQDTGQQIVPIKGGAPELTGVSPTTQVGTPITKQLPTGTQRVITDPAEATRLGVPVGTSIFVGGGGGQGGGGKVTPPAVSSMQPGQSESLKSRAEAAASDWKQTQMDASFATKKIGLLQLVKEYSNAAVTGSHTDARQYLNKLASTFGLPGADIQSATDTDLLNKVSAMITQEGGNTDAARILAESANPNRHMTADAIKKAANQLIGQEKLKLVKQAVMQQFQTDPEKYSKALTQYSQIADPNVLQYSSMTEAEQKRFKSSMTANEQKSFEKKLHALDVLNRKYNLGLM